MFVASCPLRIALFGGSTDNPYFVEKYGRGCVINFTSNLKTYITLHEDKLGFNREGRKYIVNYSRSCLLYTSPSPRDLSTSRMPSSA